MKRWGGLFMIGILLVSGLSYAEEMMSLTLESSVNMALEKNPEFQIAKKEIKKASAGVWEAYSAILPAVTGQVNYQRSWEIQENTMPNFIKSMLLPMQDVFPEVASMEDYVKLSFGMENTLSYGAQLTQPLFLGGAGLAGIKMAYASKNIAEEQYESKKQMLVFQTTNAFYQCILTREVVSVQEEALKQADENLDVVRKKYDVGSASGFDKMRAEVEVANLKPEVISAKNNYQAALTNLRTILGLGGNHPIEIIGDLAFQADDLDNVSLETLQNKAKVNRPEIKTMQAQKRLSVNSVRIARSEFLPKIIFSTDYSFLAMGNDLNFKQDDFSKGFTSAVSLQVPLFKGFKNCKRYQKARLDQKIVLDSEKQLLSGIEADVEIAYNNFKESQEKYQASSESVALAKEALRLAILMYDEGASTQLDVLNSRLALTRSKLGNATALYEYQMARYGLRRATGTLNGIL